MMLPRLSFAKQQRGKVCLSVADLALESFPTFHRALERNPAPKRFKASLDLELAKAEFKFIGPAIAFKREGFGSIRIIGKALAHKLRTKAAMRASAFLIRSR